MHEPFSWTGGPSGSSLHCIDETKALQRFHTSTVPFGFYFYFHLEFTSPSECEKSCRCPDRKISTGKRQWPAKASRQVKSKVLTSLSSESTHTNLRIRVSSVRL